MAGTKFPGNINYRIYLRRNIDDPETSVTIAPRATRLPVNSVLVSIGERDFLSFRPRSSMRKLVTPRNVGFRAWQANRTHRNRRSKGDADVETFVNNISRH